MRVVQHGVRRPEKLGEVAHQLALAGLRPGHHRHAQNAEQTRLQQSSAAGIGVEDTARQWSEPRLCQPDEARPAHADHLLGGQGLPASARPGRHFRHLAQRDGPRDCAAARRRPERVVLHKGRQGRNLHCIALRAVQPGCQRVRLPASGGCRREVGSNRPSQAELALPYFWAIADS